MASLCFWDIATVNCVAYGLRSRSSRGSQYLDDIYLFEEGFQTTWQFQGLETGILYTSIGRELCFWSERFAWGSDQFREGGAQGIPIGIMWHYQNSPSLRCGGAGFTFGLCPLILHISLRKLWFSHLSGGTNNMRLGRTQLGYTWKSLLRSLAHLRCLILARWMLLAPGKQFQLKACREGLRSRLKGRIVPPW